MIENFALQVTVDQASYVTDWMGTTVNTWLMFLLYGFAIIGIICFIEKMDKTDDIKDLFVAKPRKKKLKTGYEQKRDFT